MPYGFMPYTVYLIHVSLCRRGIAVNVQSNVWASIDICQFFTGSRNQRVEFFHRQNLAICQWEKSHRSDKVSHVRQVCLPNAAVKAICSSYRFSLGRVLHRDDNLCGISYQCARRRLAHLVCQW